MKVNRATPHVFVYCDTHPQRVPIATFVPVDTGGSDPEWVYGPHMSVRAGRSPEMPARTVLFGDKTAEGLLANDTAGMALAQAPSTRESYRLECPRCRQAVAIRGEKLSEALTRLWSAGIGEVSLKGLQYGASCL